MPIYEFRCPKCDKKRDTLLSVDDRNSPQPCECGEVMTRLMSVPMPPVMVDTNRGRLVNTINGDSRRYGMSGNAVQRARYENVIGNSLFHQEKPVIGKGFGG